jgi:MFS family permease
MPQAFAAMSTKVLLPRILNRVGYRAVLISNTVVLGLLLMLFATIGRATPLWLIVMQAVCYGSLTSLQYTSMNTLVYTDVPVAKTSGASSLASTMQQLSVSFGVAAAALVTVFFIPDSLRNNPSEMLHGLHLAFLVLGGFTVLSTFVFRRLRSDDGADEAQAKTSMLAESPALVGTDQDVAK